VIGDGKAKMTEVIRAAAKDAGTLMTVALALAALALGVGMAALLLALRQRPALWRSRRPTRKRNRSTPRSSRQWG
jgi:hypothetical protein